MPDIETIFAILRAVSTAIDVATKTLAGYRWLRDRVTWSGTMLAMRRFVTALLVVLALSGCGAPESTSSAEPYAAHDQFIATCQEVGQYLARQGSDRPGFDRDAVAARYRADAIERRPEWPTLTEELRQATLDGVDAGARGDCDPE